MTEYCLLIGPQYPVQWDNSCIRSWPNPSLLWKWAGSWD